MSVNRTMLVEQLARASKPTATATPVLRTPLTCVHCGAFVNPFAPGGETTICYSVECFDAAVTELEATTTRTPR